MIYVRSEYYYLILCYWNERQCQLCFELSTFSLPVLANKSVGKVRVWFFVRGLSVTSDPPNGKI